MTECWDFYTNATLCINPCLLSLGDDWLAPWIRRERVHLVTGGHFRSPDKDGGHTIRSPITENPMLPANFMALCFIEPELLPFEVLHCGNRDFRPFCFCDLDLYPMTFVHEVDPYSLEIYRMCKCELPSLWLSKVIVLQTDRDRQRHDRNYIRLFAGGQYDIVGWLVWRSD